MYYCQLNVGPDAQVPRGQKKFWSWFLRRNEYRFRFRKYGMQHIGENVTGILQGKGDTM